MMTKLRNASRRGVPIVVLNPLRERALERFAAPARYQSKWSRLRSSGLRARYCQWFSVGAATVAALKGIMKRGARRTRQGPSERGAEAGSRRRVSSSSIRTASAHLPRICAAPIGTTFCACPACRASRVGAVATIYMKANAVIVCYGMGITKHRHGLGERAATSSICFCFAGISASRAPVFARCAGTRTCKEIGTVGVDEKPKPSCSTRSKSVRGFKPPRKHGHAVVDAVQAMIEGRAKVFVGLGGNFIAAVPDKPIAEAAMRRLRLSVAILHPSSTVVTSSTASRH